MKRLITTLLVTAMVTAPALGQVAAEAADASSTVKTIALGQVAAGTADASCTAIIPGPIEMVCHYYCADKVRKETKAVEQWVGSKLTRAWSWIYGN